MSNDLAVSAQIYGPSGWIVLEDPTNGYELHADSFASRARTSRRNDITGDWSKGSYTNRAVSDNVPEAVVVIVTGPTPYDLATRVQTLLAAFEQLQFSFQYTQGNLQETWTCMYSDCTIEQTHEQRFSNMAVVRATVPRLPDLVLASV